ncbi:unknown (plasmid) [Halobacterium salinarum NRC-1]|uniref:Arsenite methyltransferase n=5 Tax=Halobacterium salinarum TaxID=2242 RepID=ARSM_HALSA|nr:RecName: Full=Arsenite methyltransferase [Halobacterium salinarum NRC-1]AAC82905.1 unknown [Halobacterium salinarum NRC-1]
MELWTHPTPAAPRLATSTRTRWRRTSRCSQPWATTPGTNSSDASRTPTTASASATSKPQSASARARSVRRSPDCTPRAWSRGARKDRGATTNRPRRPKFCSKRSTTCEATMSNDNETMVADRDPEETREMVRERYAGIATSGQDCCGDVGLDVSGDGGCCSDETEASGSERLGYDADDVASVADGADLGLGCGNPKAFAAMAPGETVLDLGSGAGFDCFLAAQEVGPDGHVIGVDMTPEMISKARENVAKNDAENVEFRLGEIGHLPVADESVNVVISNCVVNLAPEKQRVFDDTYRVLRPGGRVAISDVVQTAPFPDDVQMDPDSLTGCVAGASTVDDLKAMLDEAGFEAVEIAPKDESTEFISDWDADRDLGEYLVSATIEARKPARDD